MKTETLALSDVLSERKRQDRKWGEQNHEPLVWLAILGEEYGEACAALLQRHLVGSRKHRDELVQVAAVALAAIESFDRRYYNKV